MRYFEDFAPGMTLELGRRTVSREEMIDFARSWDPQPFHVDEEAAAATPFGGLIASGWQTAAVFMRLLVDAMLHDAASLGSPGVQELRWRHPVRPGDTLSGTVQVVDATPSSRRPERGTLHCTGELVNQDGTVVLTMQWRALLARRPGCEALPPSAT